MANSVAPALDSTRFALFTTYFIYFFCGLTMCFESIFLPEFKEHFHLNYQEQMYTMFAKNIPFLIAPAIGYLIRYTGYRRCMTVATSLFAAGTLLLIPGLRSGSYMVVLAGFLLIGIGFNCELVAGNPLLSGLGPAAGASSRLNLGNALGAVAQILGPAAVTLMIPATVITVQGKLPYIEGLFIFSGAVLAIVALVTTKTQEIDIDRHFESSAADGNPLLHPRVVFGFVAIMVCLGVEAGQFGFYRNFLEDPEIAGLSSRDSQRLVTVFFAVFAAGRLAATWMQRRISPSMHILLNMLGAVVCLTVAITTRGWLAVAAVTSLAFFVSILFPTLYAIANQNMGRMTSRVSGLLTMGFIGCAFIPVLQGRIADAIGLRKSYAIGYAAYALAVLFALYVSTGKRAHFIGRKLVSEGS